MMPRNIRNWWIEGKIDGRETYMSGGPRSIDGGFDITILQRDKSTIRNALRIQGLAKANGELTLNVYDHRDRKVFEFGTER